jgi:hypothetical protein
MVEAVMEATEREAQAARLEAQMAEVCGVLNAANGRLVALIAEVLAAGAWQGAGIRSAAHWVAWRCGVSPRRAHTLVAMARRLAELPVTRAALEAGEISDEQTAVICRRAPAAIDHEVATLARSASVTQLQRVLGSYAHDPEPEEPEPEAPEERRRVSFGFDDEGSWRLSALLPPDQGALWERALAQARDALFGSAHPQAGTDEASSADVSWADALVAVAEGYLASAAGQRPHHERTLVLLHLSSGADEVIGGHLHGGPALAGGLRRFLSCDARIRPVLESGGRPVSVGRAFRSVPERTRVVIEDRDRGCRVPGCASSRWTQVHHVRHWEDGGGTDTSNLVELCAAHHRLHHRGGLGIEGNADDSDGLVFTDHRGRRLTGTGRPAPPGRPLEEAAQGLGIPTAAYTCPTGERLDAHWVHFNRPSSLN